MSGKAKQLLLSLFVLGIATNPATATDAETAQANALFRRLTGTALPFGDQRRVQMVQKLRDGKPREAARIATEDDNFLNTTLLHWSSSLSNRAESPLTSTNDFIQMIVGTARDDRDVREILYADFRYDLPQGESSYRKLTRVEPQSAAREEAAGVLSSDQWGREHLYMGTNRRGLEFAFREFLCAPIADLADGSIPDSFVRRDVDRRPGGDSRTYENKCRRCHGGMDALGGAFAYFSSDNRSTVYEKRVQRKMNQNGDVYPAGRITIDDSWVNLWTSGQNATLGWRGPTRGRGLSQFGKMLSNSVAFSRCLVTRVFTEVCRRAPAADETALVQSLVNDFEQNGYRLRGLFEAVATAPGCVGTR